MLWTPVTNTPTVLDGTGSNGYFYIVSEPGSHDLSELQDGTNIVTVEAGDHIIYTTDSTTGKWERSINSDKIIADWNQLDPLLSDYIKNKPTDLTVLQNHTLEAIGDVNITNRTIHSGLKWSGTEWIISTPELLTMLDTPTSYTGYAGYTLKVKTDETGIEFTPEEISDSVTSTLTTDTTITTFTQDLFFIDASLNDVTLTLPLAINLTFPITIKRIDSTSNTVTITATEGIDDSTEVLLNPFDSASLVSNAIQYYII